jgi:glycosyltransferase involved in cell wall biosynthesis
MTKDSLVSVIIPFLNTEPYLQEAIESVLAQTYQNWELILVDDGSTDGSTSIARKYAEQYPKILYLEHEGHQNRGATVSRNLGLQDAGGEYIALLDADDVWLPMKLEQQVAIMEAYPQAGMVYGKSQYWYSWTKKSEDAQRDCIPDLEVQTETLFEPPMLMTLCHPLGEGCAPPPSDVLFRRGILGKIGGFEDEFQGIYQLYEDQAFLTKIYLHESVFVSSQYWDKYRIHSASCSSSVNRGNHYDEVRLFYLNWLKKYLTDQGIKDYQVQRALRKAFFPYHYPTLYKLQKHFNYFLSFS